MVAETGKGHSQKQCTECRVVRPLDDFPRVASNRVARRAKCKECVKSRKQTKSYRQQQRDRTKALRYQNPDYRANELRKAREYGLTPRGRAIRLWNAAKHRAKIGGFAFDISVHHVQLVLMIGVCQRTGIPFDFSAPIEGKNFNPYSPSIDKKNPFGGYTSDNIQVVSNAYNLAKNQFTDEQFVEFCKLVVNKNVK